MSVSGKSTSASKAMASLSPCAFAATVARGSSDMKPLIGSVSDGAWTSRSHAGSLPISRKWPVSVAAGSATVASSSRSSIEPLAAALTRIDSSSRVSSGLTTSSTSTAISFSPCNAMYPLPSASYQGVLASNRSIRKLSCHRPAIMAESKLSSLSPPNPSNVASSTASCPTTISSGSCSLANISCRSVLLSPFLSLRMIRRLKPDASARSTTTRIGSNSSLAVRTMLSRSRSTASLSKAKPCRATPEPISPATLAAVNAPPVADSACDHSHCAPDSVCNSQYQVPATSSAGAIARNSSMRRRLTTAASRSSGGNETACLRNQSPAPRRNEFRPRRNTSVCQYRSRA